ncbi:MAG: diacylglycerol kinase [bacterium]
MAKPGLKGINRVVAATRYSIKGLTAAFQYEAAFRQELFLVLILTPIAFWIEADIFNRAILIASLVFLLIVEIINSAIEAVVDRISDEHHPLSGRAKDMGSAAVMMALLIVCILWLSSLYNFVF